eukprot:9245452-Pyramimonas_sp.AAC.1
MSQPLPGDTTLHCFSGFGHSKFYLASSCIPGSQCVEDAIRQYNYDAYTAVVRAFSLGELSWAKDAVLTELRQHLDISGTDEAEIKMLVMRDDGIAALSSSGKPNLLVNGSDDQLSTPNRLWCWDQSPDRI